MSDHIKALEAAKRDLLYKNTQLNAQVVHFRNEFERVKKERDEGLQEISQRYEYRANQLFKHLEKVLSNEQMEKARKIFPMQPRIR